MTSVASDWIEQGNFRDNAIRGSEKLRNAIFKAFVQPAPKHPPRPMGTRRVARSEIMHIRDGVASFYGLTPEDLVSSDRKWRIARPRHVAMYLARVKTEASFPVIADHFGGRDHTTVMHAVNTVEGRVKIDPAFRQELAQLAERLGG